jgi:hypothetical protein
VQHLKPNGRFWIDIFNPDLRLLAGEQSRGFDPNCFFVPSLGRTIYQTTDIRRDIARQSQDITFNYNWFDDNGNQHREKNTFTMTWIFPRELQLLLERNGLQIEYLFGNYDGSEVKNDSPRLIARCVRIR